LKAARNLSLAPKVETQIYIHIGTHKTGSTTIQHVLQNANRSSLHEEWKYLYDFRCLKGFAKADKYDERLVRDVNAEICHLMERYERSGYPISRFVISREGLSGWPLNGYQNSAIVASMLREATKSFKVKVIVYLRRQDQFVESMYTQMVQQGESLDFKKFLNHYQGEDALNYSRMLQDFRKYFGANNLIVRSYHEAKKQGLLKDFSEIIGSVETFNNVVLAEPIKKWRNPSLSYQAIEIARIANSDLNQEQIKLLTKALQQVMPKNHAEPHKFFSDDERNKFMRKYTQSNKEVADLYFNGESVKMFPEPCATKKNMDQTNITHEQVGQLVYQLLSENNMTFKRDTASISIRVFLSRFPRIKKIIRRIISLR
jgi:hypothetical protein